MKPRPWFLRERYWAIAAVLAVACACWCTHCRGAEPVVRISQSGYLTHGAVVHSDLRGCLILTTKHGRKAGDPWKAGKLSGTRTLLDQHHDLALLITDQPWRGPVLRLAEAEPRLPIVFAHSPLLPKPLPWGCPLLQAPGTVKPGDSGKPLVVGDRLAGVLFDRSEGGGLYIPRAAVERFLKEVKP